LLLKLEGVQEEEEEEEESIKAYRDCIMLDSKMGGALNLASLNHISLVCRSVEGSLDFYQNVLGFVPVRRPGSFDFDGAW